MTETQKQENLRALGELVNQFELSVRADERKRMAAVYVPDISTGMVTSDGEDCGKPGARYICLACNRDCRWYWDGNNVRVSLCCHAGVREVVG